MITKIAGEISKLTPTSIEILVGNIINAAKAQMCCLGYTVQISVKTYEAIKKSDPSYVMLHTVFVVREQKQELWGFVTEEERETFLLLSSVHRIGHNTARLILSKYVPEEVEQIVLGEDISAMSKVKGVGPKTAKALILDLKPKLEKMGKELGEGLRVIRHSPQKENKQRADALQALVTLGFDKIKVQKALNNILKTKPNATTEELIGEVLKLKM